jgi:hypothetical protein
MFQNIKIALAGVLVVTSFSASAAIASTPTQPKSPVTHVSTSLQSKYAYFLKNNSVVINGILSTKCRPNGYSFKWREGAEIWVSQTRKYTQGGVAMFPTIAYRKAASATGKFVLTPAGESKLWWTTKWGCPVSGAFNTYGTQVTMTTQELINAGY